MSRSEYFCIVGKDDLLAQIAILDLFRTSITSRGLDQMKSFPKLEWLNLDGTQVADQGLTRLETNRQLKWLSVRETQVTEAGVARLSASLPTVIIRHDFETW